MIFPIRRTGIHQLMLSRDYDVKIDRYLNKTRIYLEQNNFFFCQQFTISSISTNNLAVKCNKKDSTSYRFFYSINEYVTYIYRIEHINKISIS